MMKLTITNRMKYSLVVDNATLHAGKTLEITCDQIPNDVSALAIEGYIHYTSSEVEVTKKSNKESNKGEDN